MLRQIALPLLALLSATAQSFAQAPNPSFNLVNKTSQPIRELHLSPAGRASFGAKNWLSAPAAPGAKVPVRLPVTGDCIFDIEVVYADATKQQQKGLNVCQTDDVTFTRAKAATDPSFRLINRATQPVIELSATPPGKPRGANLLTTPLQPGASVPVKPEPGGCSFDLRLVFADKTAKERRATNLCTITDLPVP